MPAHVTTVTRKGQMTIPVEIRRSLGIEPGDQVAVEQHGDTVVLRRAQTITDQTAGALAQYRLKVPLGLAAERAAFEQAVADEQTTKGT